MQKPYLHAFAKNAKTISSCICNTFCRRSNSFLSCFRFLVTSFKRRSNTWYPRLYSANFPSNINAYSEIKHRYKCLKKYFFITILNYNEMTTMKWHLSFKKLSNARLIQSFLLSFRTTLGFFKGNNKIIQNSLPHRIPINTKFSRRLNKLPRDKFPSKS